jgi:molybdate transport system ATP-binding protein
MTVLSFLQISNLTVKRGEFTLKDINLSIEKGTYTIIFGKTGTGKSTLLLTLAGFIKPIKGQIFLEGKNITHTPPWKRNISLVFQEPLLFDHLTVFENIAFGLRKKIREEKIIEEKVRKIAEEMEISHLLNRNPQELSGGERQRVALARALVVSPKLLLMDEPFSSLDWNTKTYLRNFIKNIASSKNMTIIQVSHDLEDLLNLSTHIVFIKNGIIQLTGSREEILKCPKDKLLAKILGINLFEILKIDKEEILILKEGLKLKKKGLEEFIEEGYLCIPAWKIKVGEPNNPNGRLKGILKEKIFHTPYSVILIFEIPSTSLSISVITEIKEAYKLQTNHIYSLLF